MRASRRAQGGFVLLVVLALLVVLTIVASMVYARASDQVIVSHALRHQMIAQDRAMQAAEAAIVDLKKTNKPAYLANLTGMPPCVQPDPISALQICQPSTNGVPG